jgi:hypothetical protein
VKTREKISRRGGYGSGGLPARDSGAAGIVSSPAAYSSFQTNKKMYIGLKRCLQQKGANW